MTLKMKERSVVSASYPEQAGEPAVLQRVKQVQVVVEVTLQRLFLFFVTNAAKQNRPARWTHREGKTRARRRLVAGGVHPGPGPLLWRERRRRKISQHYDKQLDAQKSRADSIALSPWLSLPSRFRRNMSEWMVPFSTSFFTLWKEQIQLLG